jgi:enoyl-CoA hydratase
MDEGFVIYSCEGPVARIQLNRPRQHNALTDAMLEEIVALVRRADSDDEVKVIVLEGNGPSFSAGFDMSNPDDFYGGAETKGTRFAIRKLRSRADVMRELLYSGTPIIAKVHANCIGAGMYLVLVCSMAVASDDAVFGLPEERFGSSGTSWLFPFLVSQCGVKKATELVMTGRKLAAAEAERLNLINRVVPRERLDEATDELVKAVTSLPRDGIAISRTVAHLSFDMLGIGSAFTPHYTAHPMVVRMQRETDEFDFHGESRARGMKAAIEERDRRFGGEYWGW